MKVWMIKVNHNGYSYQVFSKSKWTKKQVIQIRDLFHPECCIFSGELNINEKKMD